MRLNCPEHQLLLPVNIEDSLLDHLALGFLSCHISPTCTDKPVLATYCLLFFLNNNHWGGFFLEVFLGSHRLPIAIIF